MRVSIISQIKDEHKRIQQSSVTTDPELIIQSFNHLRNLIRAMEKSNPGSMPYKLSLTSLYQYDRKELNQIRLLHNKQWEDNLAKTAYLEALERIQCVVNCAVAFLPVE